MRIDAIYLSLHARDFDALGVWWTTLIGREPDRFPMPSCKEWDLRDGVHFQVLSTEGDRTAVSLHVADLDAEVARLRGAGLDIPDPGPVPGVGTLRMTTFPDPEGNRVALLEGA